MPTSFREPSVRIALLAAAGHVLLGCAGAPLPASDSTQQSAATSPALPAGSAPGKAGEGVTANCDSGATHMTGPYRYNNNQWGSNKAKSKAQQCLLTREVAGRTELGWTWNWPGFDNTVFAYPEIEFGWKPWSGGKSTDARFPIQVSQIPHLAMNYEVETDANGSYDLAPEVWLTSSPGGGQKPDPLSITTEVMFWMEYASGAVPAGSVIEKTTLDGVDYELWKEDHIGANANGNGKGWRLLSFKSPTVRRQGTINVDVLLKHLVDLKLVSAEDYLASVEFGNEVMGGSGTTWVKRFDIDVGGAH